MARIENDVRSGVIQAGFVAANLPRFAKQPKLQEREKTARLALIKGT